MRPHLPTVLAVLLSTTGAGPAFGLTLNIQRLATGFDRPSYVTAAPGDERRLFVLEQHSGRIRIFDRMTGVVRSEPFLTIGGLATGNEQGLLGLAFDPAYATNGRFYVNYTDAVGTTRVVRYEVSADPDLADAASARPVMSYAQPFANHNGGWMGFGLDGMLYISSGDGGGRDDPGNRAQDITDQRLGKILRIDPGGDDFAADDTRNYAVPADNPFAGATPGDGEIWAYGLRNPWRASFDRLTGDFYIADVGQGAREELNFQPAGSGGGENYGWRLREGSIATPSGGVGGPAPPGAVDPIYEYLHGTGSDEGFAVTGGYVYRGSDPRLQGEYFFADFATARLWSLSFDGTGWRFADWTPLLDVDAGLINQISSFGEDDAGNLYFLDLGTADGDPGGELYQIVSLVPLPPAVLLFAPALLALGARLRRGGPRTGAPACRTR